MLHSWQENVYSKSKHTMLKTLSHESAYLLT